MWMMQWGTRVVYQGLTHVHSIEVVPSFTPVPSCKPLLHWFMGEYLSDYGIDLTVVYMDLSDEGVSGWCMRGRTMSLSFKSMKIYG